MNVLDLFSGIGGFSLGLERAGMRTIAFSEVDPFCCAVLAKRWPGVPNLGDIRAVDADRLGGLGRIDLVCGGFPCQPFSHAGKQRAQADDRHLWPEMCRVIALARPSWVLGENVAGIIPLALDDVLADLEGLGYAAKPFAIPAVAVDAKHRRERIWIVARYPNGKGQSARAFDEKMERLRGADTDADSAGLEGRKRSSMRECGAERIAGESGASIADAQSVLRAAFLRDESNGTHDTARCTWLPEPGVGRVADGVPRRVDRLRTLGNAVVPQVVEEIGRAIMRCAK